METLRRLLPSLGSLVVFEAAGRLSSFSAAGRELAMSQAAVSYAIARLEGGRRADIHGDRCPTLAPAGVVCAAKVMFWL